MKKIFDIYPIKGDIQLTRLQILQNCFCFTIEPETTWDIDIMLDIVYPFIRDNWAFYVYDRTTGYFDYFKTYESMKNELIYDMIHTL